MTTMFAGNRSIQIRVRDRARSCTWKRHGPPRASCGMAAAILMVELVGRRIGAEENSRTLKARPEAALLNGVFGGKNHGERKRLLPRCGAPATICRKMWDRKAREYTIIKVAASTTRPYGRSTIRDMVRVPGVPSFAKAANISCRESKIRFVREPPSGDAALSRASDPTARVQIPTPCLGGSALAAFAGQSTRLYSRHS